MRRCDCLVIDPSLYDVFLCVDETGLMISESANFGGGGFSGTDTLGTDALFDTTLRSGSGWGTASVDCGVSSDSNVG